MQVISLEFAKELKGKEFLIIPGYKVCENCVYNAVLTGDSTDSEKNTCVVSLSNRQLKTGLSGIGQPHPIKLHSMPSCS